MKIKLDGLITAEGSLLLNMKKGLNGLIKTLPAGDADSIYFRTTPLFFSIIKSLIIWLRDLILRIESKDSVIKSAYL